MGTVAAGEIDEGAGSIVELAMVLESLQIWWLTLFTARPLAPR